MKKILLSSTILLAASAAQANDVQWNQIAISGVAVSVDGIDDNLYGAALSGSVLLNDSIFFFGKLESAESDITESGIKLNVEVSRWGLGVGYRYGVSQTTDVFAKAQVQHYRTEASNSVVSVEADTNAVAAGLGIRSMITKSVELGASYDFINYSDDDDDEGSGGTDAELTVSAAYHFNDRFALGLGYSRMDDVDFTSATGTLSF